MYYKKSCSIKNAYMCSILKIDNSWIEMSDDLFQQDDELGDYYLKSFLSNPDECYLTYHQLYEAQKKQMEKQKYLNDTDYIITKLNEIKLTGTDEEFNQLREEYAEILTNRVASRKALSDLKQQIVILENKFNSLNILEGD